MVINRDCDGDLYATTADDMSVSEVIKLFESNDELSHAYWDNSGRFYSFATREMLDKGYYHYCDSKTNSTQERWFRYE